MLLTSKRKTSVIGFSTVIVCLLCFSCKTTESERQYREALNYYKNMDFVNAEKECNKIASSSEIFLKGLLLKSKILFYTGRKKESVHLLNKIVKKKPCFIDAKFFLIKALIETKEYELAETILAKLTEENSSDFRVYALYSYLGKKRKDLKSRLYFQKKAEDCLAECAFVFLDLASIYKEFGMEKESIEYFDKAELLIKYNPKNHNE